MMSLARRQRTDCGNNGSNNRCKFRRLKSHRLRDAGFYNRGLFGDHVTKKW